MITRTNIWSPTGDIGQLGCQPVFGSPRLSCSAFFFPQTRGCPSCRRIQNRHIDDRHIDDQQMKFAFESRHLLAPLNQCLPKNFQHRIVRCIGCEKLYRSALPVPRSIRSCHPHSEPETHRALLNNPHRKSVLRSRGFRCFKRIETVIVLLWPLQTPLTSRFIALCGP